MNDKHYVGRRVSTHEWYDEIGPITGVALLLDDNNEIIAGDETGYMLEVDCKYGTQEMADNILASLSNKTYKGFRSTGAILSPTAELGDGITVDGGYSLLAYRTVDFGPGHMSEIAAPGESTQEYEYQYKSPAQRKTDRKLAQTQSLISKTSEEISLAVKGLSAELGHTLRLDANGLYITDAKGKTVTISGGQIDASTINAAEIKAENINASKINAKDLVLSGTLQFTDFDTATQGEIATNSGLSGGTTKISGNCIQTGTIAAARLDLSGVASISSLQNGTTTINGGCIQTGTISAERLDLSGVASISSLSNGTTTINGGCIKTGTIAAARLDLSGVASISSLQNGTTTINGGCITTGTVAAARLDLSGVASISSLSGGTTTIDGACIKTGTINASRLDLSGVASISSLSNGTTTINGGCIKTGTIAAERLDLSGVASISSLSNGTTTINGGCIKSGEIEAKYLKLNGAIKFTDLNTETQNKINSAVTSLPGYIQSTHIESAEIRSPIIKGNKIEAVIPKGAGDDVGFILTSALSNKDYRYLRIYSHDMNVVFSSPGSFDATWDFGVTYFIGTLDFTGATARGLHLTFS